MNPRPVFLALATIAVSIVFCLCAIEIGLRFFPVQTYMKPLPVTGADPVLRYAPDRDFIYSFGPMFEAFNKGYVNKQGWVNNQDYVNNDATPLIAVVGDSYIAARMVRYDQTIQGRLAEELKDENRVYSFGIDGSPLSQYLVYAQYARDNYRPDLLIVTIVGNDFDESLPQYNNKPRFHYFVKDKNGDLIPQLIGEYHPSRLKEALSYSALIRFVYFHLKLSGIYNKILFYKRGKNTPTYIGTVEANASNQKISDSKKAIDAFLNRLPSYSGLPPNKIILVVDAVRTDIYNKTDNQNSYFGKMRRHLIENGRKRGYTLVDMQPAFEKHYSQNHQQFEFKHDWHWNALGHEIATQEILATKPLRRLLKN